GSLVGSGAGSPSSAPALEASGRGAVTASAPQYCYTWVSALGESINSPGTAIGITAGAPGAVAPTVAVAEGSGLPAGVYIYGVSHVLDAGESAVVSAGLTT